MVVVAAHVDQFACFADVTKPIEHCPMSARQLAKVEVVDSIAVHDEPIEGLPIQHIREQVHIAVATSKMNIGKYQRSPANIVHSCCEGQMKTS